MIIRQHDQSGFIETNSIHPVAIPVTDDGLPTRFPRTKIEGGIADPRTADITQDEQPVTVYANAIDTITIPVTDQWCPTRFSRTKAEGDVWYAAVERRELPHTVPVQPNRTLEHIRTGGCRDRCF